MVEKPDLHGFRGGQTCIVWFSGWTSLYSKVLMVEKPDLHGFRGEKTCIV